mgnify:FL=1
MHQRTRGERRGKISSGVVQHHRTLWLITLLLVVLLLFLVVGPRITGRVYYYDYGSRGYGGGFQWMQFSDIYYQYGYIIDATIFLLIFLSLAKIVFTKHFGEPVKPLYIGVGLFLAFALLLWEERTGIYLLELAGPLAAVLIPLVVVVALFIILKRTSFGFFPALFISLIVIYALLWALNLASLTSYYAIINFLYSLWYPLGAMFDCVISRSASNCGNSTFMIGVVLVLLVGSLIFRHIQKKYWQKKPKNP